MSAISRLSKACVEGTSMSREVRIVCRVTPA
jgi:hypothetical protein